MTQAQMKKGILISLGFIFLVNPAITFGHKNHPHTHDEKKEGKMPIEKIEGVTQMRIINESYKRDVKPIFQRSCFDCHSQTPYMPWYSALPIVHGFLLGDMKEAKEHLDFTDDFPFKGHGEPKEDLEAIADSVRDKSMPPLRYRLMHWKSALTNDEVKTVLKWAAEGQQIFSKGPHAH